MSFTTWFEDELPGTEILQAYYEEYDNWNGGTYYLGIDFEKEYRLNKIAARWPAKVTHGAFSFSQKTVVNEP